MKNGKLLVLGLIAPVLAGGVIVLTKLVGVSQPEPSPPVGTPPVGTPPVGKTGVVAIERPPAKTPKLPVSEREVYKTTVSSLKKALESNDWKGVESVWGQMLQDPGRDRRVALLTDFIRAVAPISPELSLRLVKQMDLGEIRERIYSEMIRRLPLDNVVKFYESDRLLQDTEDSRALAREFAARPDAFADALKLAAGKRETDLGKYALESAAFKVRTVDELHQVVAFASQFHVPTEQILRGAIQHLNMLGEKVAFDSLAMDEGLPMPIRRESAKSHAKKLADSSPEAAVNYSMSQVASGTGADALVATFPLWLKDQPVAATAWMDKVNNVGVQKLLIPVIAKYCEQHNMPVEANAWRAKLYQVDRPHWGQAASSDN